MYTRCCLRTVVLFALLLGGCGPRTATGSATHLNVTDAAVSTSFEDAAAALTGWHSGSEGYLVAVDRKHAHQGVQSVRIERQNGPPGSYGYVVKTISADSLRGKHVRWSGWVKRLGGTFGIAAPWLRVDGPYDDVLYLNSMVRDGLKTNDEWIRLTVETDVPVEAVSVSLGALLYGDGTAWFDDAVLDIQPPKKKPWLLQGVVTDEQGRQVQDATVTLMAAGQFVASRQSDSSGRFSFEAESDVAEVSAWKRGMGVAFTADLHDGAALTALKLDASSAVAITGALKFDGTLPEDAIVYCTVESKHTGDGFAATVEGAHFSVLLPKSETGYRFKLLSRAADGATRVAASADAPASAELPVAISYQAPREAIQWLKEHLVELGPSVLQGNADGIDQLAREIGPGKILALGEATHGSGELFRIKQAFIEMAVHHLGYHLIAFEGSWLDEMALNRFIHGEEVNVRETLSRSPYWMWSTEEVLSLLEWLRSWNAAAPPGDDVSLVGIDVVSSDPADVARLVSSILQDEGLSGLDARLSKLDVLFHNKVSSLVADAASAYASELEAISVEVESRAKQAGRYTPKLADASHGLLLLVQRIRFQQAALAATSSKKIIEMRDEFMATNLLDIEDKKGSGHGAILWAHNMHIAASLDLFANLGTRLRGKLGDRYFSVGLLCRAGSFQSQGRGEYEGTGVRAFSLGELATVDVTDIFAALKSRLSWVLLRGTTDQRAKGWLDAKQTMVAAGDGFSGPASARQMIRIGAAFDAIVYVQSVTRAVPIRGPLSRPR
jgi:erythromycin esterase